MVDRATVRCPRCDGPMVARDGPRGRFWGCRRFPNCRGTRPYGTTKIRGVGREAHRRRKAPPPVPTVSLIPVQTVMPPPASPSSTPDLPARTTSQRSRSKLWLAGLAIVAIGITGWVASPHSAPPRASPSYAPAGAGGPQYNGYTVRCADGWISQSGGRQGACSHHGGVR
jgi:hypothetical protein